MSDAAACPIFRSMSRKRASNSCPKSVTLAPPPCVPPRFDSTTTSLNMWFKASTRSQARRYDMPIARPAAEIEPVAWMWFSSSIFPRPSRSPSGKSIRKTNRNLLGVPSIFLPLPRDFLVEEDVYAGMRRVNDEPQSSLPPSRSGSGGSEPAETSSDRATNAITIVSGSARPRRLLRGRDGSRSREGPTDKGTAAFRSRQPVPSSCR